MGIRRKARELAVQMLYQWELSGEPVRRVVESFETMGEHSPAARELARRFLEGTVAHVEEIDALLSDHAERWRLARMATVDKNILRLAVFEFLHGETPPRVAINEALEVTKKFSTPEAVQFVNGVLDAVRQRVEAASEAQRG